MNEQYTDSIAWN
jgi:hypothetical protein